MSAGFSFYRAVLRRAPELVTRLDGARLRFLRYGSGALRPDEIDRIEQMFRAPLLVGLSSTESCGIAHDPLPPRRRKRGSVGLPVNGDVINRGGEKVGPIEIDLALESIAGVREAAAFAMPHPTLGEELVAAAVREPGTTLTESELVEQVRGRSSRGRCRGGSFSSNRCHGAKAARC